MYGSRRDFIQMVRTNSIGWFAMDWTIQLGVVLQFIESTAIKALIDPPSGAVKVDLLINGQRCKAPDAQVTPQNSDKFGTWKACEKCPGQLACLNGRRFDALVHIRNYSDRFDFKIQPEDAH